MSAAPWSLLTRADIRAHEAALFAAGDNPTALMTAAGTAIFFALRQQWPSARRIGVLLGSGQNAGDGLVVARLAHAAGFAVAVFGWWSPARLTGAAAFMAQQWSAVIEQPQSGDMPELTDAEALSSSAFEVIVDAGFGIGFHPDRVMSPEITAWIDAVNACRQRGAAVLAVDLPSGLCVDTGRGDALIAADLTVTFFGLKIGLFTGQGAAVRGRVVLALLGRKPPPRGLPLWVDAPALPPKPRAGHKGSFGTVLIVAGHQGMAGAARMAAEAALRSGAGKVIVGTHPAHAAELGIGRPELIVYGVDDPALLRPICAQAQAVVLGCGLGSDAWARAMIDAVWSAAVPMVVDADALQALSRQPPRTAATLITPHPAEAARLLACRTADIERDRLAAARALYERFNAGVLLKGAGSVLCTSTGLSVCGRGDPALATAGSGDVLAGVMGGLLALGLSPEAALRRAVCWHAQAGEIIAARDGAWGAAATDFIPIIRSLINGRELESVFNEVVVWA